MAKVGILGQRHAGDGIKTTDYTPPDINAYEPGVLKMVYKVPTDVKMAVVDVDMYHGYANGNSTTAIVAISPAYTNVPVTTVVFYSNRSNVQSPEVVRRKCLVLGPGDTVFFRGTTDSSCVVTGIEHV